MDRGEYAEIKHVFGKNLSYDRPVAEGQLKEFYKECAKYQKMYLSDAILAGSTGAISSLFLAEGISRENPVLVGLGSLGLFFSAGTNLISRFNAKTRSELRYKAAAERFAHEEKITLG